MKVKTYSELINLPTFEERFEYLRLNSAVALDTFGSERYLNQKFYNSAEWKYIRDTVIIRDKGCDLGVNGHTIFGRILIHHMNPIGSKDICDVTEYLTNPEYLVCVSHITHNAIHYGNFDTLPKGPVERKPNDMCPWKR